MFAYALTIFAGAFLLFQVQPLMGKYILPWFGGGPGVWTTCMLFFQVVLLGGYGYAHLCTRLLKARGQALVHLGLLAAAVALLPITPGETWKPRGGGNPTLQILLLLTVSLGLPYFVLSSTGPLLQHWFTRTHPGRSPYRLFALSNFASLLALVSYPFYFETRYPRRVQAALWGWGLAAYALGCAWCALRLWNCQRRQPGAKSHPGPPPAESSVAAGVSGAPFRNPHSAIRTPWVWWLLLPACASMLLLATTNKLCLDVAVIPFLWVVPLALYLLSFVICFDNPRWYARLPFTLALVAALAGLSWALAHGSDWPLWKQVAGYCAGLFICCLVCHGELYRLRPAPEHLTSFYLLIAAGGALGGLLVAVAAPLVFTNYYELHWGLFLCGFLFVSACTAAKEPMPAAEPQQPEDGGRNSAPPPEREPSSARSGHELTTGPDWRYARAILRAVSRGRLALRRWWKHAPEGAAPTRSPGYWRWLACLLPLAACGGLDRFIASYGHHSTFHGYFLGLRLGMWGLLLVLAGAWFGRGKHKTFRFWRALTCVWLWLGLVGLGTTLWLEARRSNSEIVFTSRNFYGVLTVYEHRRDEPEEHHFLLQHGRITHGLQFVDPERASWPTTYYGAESGVGLGLNGLPAGPRRVGLVGLGTGTLTAYSRPGDYTRIYEINPAVQALATTRFSYLTRCGGKVEVALGDARLSLEREPPQQFDLLALDAFSSDAIPVHLLTKEAFELYQRHVKTNGIIAVHVSNHFLDLVPVVQNLARQFNYLSAQIDYDETDEDWWLYSSTWILLSHNAEIIHSPSIAAAAVTPKTRSVKVPLWTDDFASLFQIFK